VTRTLILLRHAHADDGGWRSDRDRPLSPRGLVDAKGAGQELARRAARPDLVYVSPAVRAETTAAAALEAAGLPPALVLESRIYEASLRTLQELVRGLPDGARCVFLVGHNPGLSELLGYLAPDAVAPLATAALVALDLSVVSWSNVTRECGRVAWRWAPRVP
jgi:phosphohistidine phosphatase